MAFSYDIIPRPKLLHSFIRGEYSLEASQQHFSELVKALEELGSERVLIDGRGVVGEPTILERFHFGEFVSDAVRALQDRSLLFPRFAYVLQEPTFDPLHFGETVAANRGMDVRTFDNIDEAIRWLELVPEDILDSL